MKWYWILYNAILFSKELTDKQKLLYVSVSSLCAATWECFASNERFIEKWFAKNWETISRNLKALESLGFLNINYEKEWSKIKKRTISTVDSRVASHWFESQWAIDSKVKDNNTSIIIQDNNKKIEKESLEIYETYLRNVSGLGKKYRKKKLSLERIGRVLKKKTKEEIIKIIKNYLNRQRETIAKGYGKAPQYFFWPVERGSKVFYYEDYEEEAYSVQDKVKEEIIF